MRQPTLFLLAAAAILPAPALAEPVLLISIDGLRPGDVIEAGQRGLNIPNLRRFVTEGAYATGVTGVLPTVTYPSHTTLLTGASPARHGVEGNNSFDPLQMNQSGWYWYATDIKLPTLWSVAGAAGLDVANVHWPVSVGATGVDWNLPQFWRTGHADDAKLLAALSTPGLVAELEQGLGETYAAGIDESLTGDENRGRFAVRLIATRKPAFATVYLTALDHEQHAEGPGSPQAKAVLERIDAIVGHLVEAELAAHPDAVIAIVSDHGFETIAHETNLFHAFIDAGLIRLDAQDKVAEWDAMPWPSGGSAAIVLARPDDPELTGRVGRLLAGLMADPANGIAAVADRAAIQRMGGNSQASFYINFNPDTVSGGFGGRASSMHGTPRYKGSHGFFPTAANLQATFLVMGRGVRAGTSLGQVDMRAIAPTLAKILEVELDGAELPAIDLTRPAQ